MGWFNAGTDNAVEAPDLMGCVSLPLPYQCFGHSGGKLPVAYFIH